MTKYVYNNFYNNIESEEPIMKKQNKRSIPHKRQRITWGFSPVTRVKPSKKRYNRKKFKKYIGILLD